MSQCPGTEVNGRVSPDARNEQEAMGTRPGTPIPCRRRTAILSHPSPLSTCAEWILGPQASPQISPPVPALATRLCLRLPDRNSSVDENGHIHRWIHKPERTKQRKWHPALRARMAPAGFQPAAGASGHHHHHHRTLVLTALLWSLTVSAFFAAAAARRARCWICARVSLAGAAFFKYKAKDREERSTTHSAQEACSISAIG